MCSVLKVSHSGYRSWLSRPESSFTVADKTDRQAVKRAFVSLKKQAGTRPIQRYLKEKENLTISRQRIGRLMKQQGTGG